MTPPQDDPVGNLGDEASKLLGALADWAGEHLGDRAREVSEHLATGGAECLYCPICRTVHAVRGASPELKSQLAQAASTFLEAAAGLLSAAAATEPQASRVQHIDLDEDDAP
ncbi:hypothetical protein [Nocardioides halotolerans]|jgi:hypothetical protein|uniref:hypothetical protein n=1 Tax=Nocardioides halotolerans TaxID=433660 RepID=UPI000424D0BB|nr:hypothetical protein [Nocardioides halotolerans]